MSDRKPKEKELPPGEFYIEKLVDRRRAEDGGHEYFVRWWGFPESSNTWEPTANIPRVVRKGYESHMRRVTKETKMENAAVKRAWLKWEKQYEDESASVTTPSNPDLSSAGSTGSGTYSSTPSAASSAETNSSSVGEDPPVLQLEADAIYELRSKRSRVTVIESVDENAGPPVLLPQRTIQIEETGKPDPPVESESMTHDGGRATGSTVLGPSCLPVAFDGKEPELTEENIVDMLAAWMEEPSPDTRTASVEEAAVGMAPGILPHVKQEDDGVSRQGSARRATYIILNRSAGSGPFYKYPEGPSVIVYGARATETSSAPSAATQCPEVGMSNL